MDLLTTAEIAKKWNITRRQISKPCVNAQGNTRLIPSDAKKPEVPRLLKQGRGQK